MFDEKRRGKLTEKCNCRADPNIE